MAHEPPSGGWPHITSPFHEAELQIQERCGVRDRMDAGARLGIRDFMPEQHRIFFAEQPYLLLGTVLDGGQPWASIVHGDPGFVHSPNPRLLRVGSLPLAADPARDSIRVGAQVGTLAIVPETRRRNRMNGRITALSAGGFDVEVVQSYGNCPQYIQSRELHGTGLSRSDDRHGVAEWADELSDADIDLLRRSDTFFIATAAQTGDATTSGADVSHRGGRPGFIRVDGRKSLTVPDFRGNFFFNTLGNLLIEPRAGLLVIDYATGDVLQATAHATIVWAGSEVERYAGAQRLLRLTVTRICRTMSALPFRWSRAELAIQTARTGHW